MQHVDVQDVILVPGLWVPGAVMWPLAWRLSRAGFRTRVFSYAGRAPLGVNVDRLAAFAGAVHGPRAAHYVGHSLGGLLVLEMLDRHAQVDAASAVLLGAPVRGSLSGRRLGNGVLGRRLLGESAPLWSEGRAARWRRSVPLGVIAGTRPWGLGRLFGRLPGDSDGVVRVDETAVEGMSEQRLVTVAHSAMLVSPAVARLVARFLARGSFDGAAQ